MSANDHLSEYQFRYRPTGPQTTYPGYGVDSEELGKNGHSLYDHEIKAIHKPTNMLVGEMLYHTDGPLFMIDVDEDHRRKGVAEGMLNHAVSTHKAAKAAGGFITHPRRSYNETDQGALWANSMIRKGLLKEN